MKRRIFSILAAMALLVTGSTALLWARSYWYSDRIHYIFLHGPERNPVMLIVYSGRGSIMIRGACVDDRVAGALPLRQRVHYGWEDGPEHPSRNELLAGHQWAFLGFGALHDWGTRTYYTSGPPPGSTSRPARLVSTTRRAQQVIRWDYGVWVPHWFIVLVAGVPAIRFLNSRRIRRRRLRLGLCLTCGYDLRASTQRCPECGVPIADRFLTVAGQTVGSEVSSRQAPSA